MKLIYKYNDQITIESEFTNIEEKNFQIKLLKYTIVDLDQDNLETSLQIYREARDEASKTAQKSNEKSTANKRSKAAPKRATDVQKPIKVEELTKEVADKVFDEEPASPSQCAYMKKLGIKFEPGITKIEAINKINEYKRANGWRVEYDPTEKK